MDSSIGGWTKTSTNLTQWARKFKKVQAKKLVKSDKSISWKNFFDQNPFFAISRMAKNQFLNWGKLPKMQFHEKKWIIWYHEFFCLDFFKFFVHIAISFFYLTVQPFSNPILWPLPTSMHQIMIILEKFWNWA